MTQTEQIRKHLRENGQVSDLEAKAKYGITKTSSIIYELRKQGWVIETQRVFGNGGIPSRVVYILKEEKCKKNSKN